MAQLESVAQILEAWYRLLGSVPTDYALTELGEAEDEIGYIYLTQGCHDAQVYLIDQGYRGWRQRTAALTWAGTDATTGGQYASLPADFLKADGHKEKSPLVKVNGDRWGQLIDDEDDNVKGNYFYFVGDKLWLARTASPPTVYLKYHYQHPEWTAAVTIDFPIIVRSLIVAYAANLAKDESWYVGDETDKRTIREAVLSAERRAQKFARQGKQNKQWRRPQIYGRW